MPEIVFFRRGEELMRVLLERDTTVLGRGAGADVVVPHPEVSRRQARIEQRDGRFFLRDLSGRGTRVGQVVCTDEIEVREGDEIGLGDFRALLVEETGDGGAMETRAHREFTDRAPAAPRNREQALSLRVRSGANERVIPLEAEPTIG